MPISSQWNVRRTVSWLVQAAALRRRLEVDSVAWNALRRVTRSQDAIGSTTSTLIKKWTTTKDDEDSVSCSLRNRRTFLWPLTAHFTRQLCCWTHISSFRSNSRHAYLKGNWQIWLWFHDAYHFKVLLHLLLHGCNFKRVELFSVGCWQGSVSWLGFAPIDSPPTTF